MTDIDAIVSMLGIVMLYAFIVGVIANAYWRLR